MMDYSEKHESDAKYLPSEEQIAHMKRVIRAENEALKQGKAHQPPVDDDCDSELENAADLECLDD